MLFLLIIAKIKKKLNKIESRILRLDYLCGV